MPRPRPPATTPQIILVGYRGCGKTSVGRRVAAELGWEFVDTDDQIEQTAGRSIADIFARDGEAAFRVLESQAIADALAGTRRVVSVGGGAVAAAENRARLRAAGTCFWLTARAEELHRRLQADPRSAQQRPALTPAAGLEEVRTVLATREPFYAEVADHVIDTSGRTVEAIAREVLSLLSQAGETTEGS